MRKDLTMLGQSTDLTPDQRFKTKLRNAKAAAWRAASPDLPDEIWRPVTLSEYSALYEVSNMGRIRSVKAAGLNQWGKVLRAATHKTGYLMVVLCHLNARRTTYVHRLVAEAFLGQPPNADMNANHIDGDKTNARASNLEWVTPSGNTRHAWSKRLTHALRGRTNGMSKMTDETVREMRRLRPTTTIHALARQFGVSRPTVKRIVSGRGWKHVSS